jgi:murein DD-endopeptidase MepM/ murein hydrolase activator NlpD
MIPQCDPPRTAHRRRAGLLGALMLLVAGTIVPSAAADGVTSDDVAAEIVRVQLRADDLADQWNQAQVRADQLTDDLAAAQARLDATTAEYQQLQDHLTTIALRRYTGAAPSALPFFGNPGDTLEQGVLQGVALDSGAADLDEVDAVRSQLADDRAEVQRLTEQNDQLAEQLAQDQADLQDQLAQLDQLHAKLVDDEVKAAYERQLAEQRQRIADQQAAAAAKAQAAAATTQAAAAPRGGGQTAPAPAATPAAAAPSATTPAASPAPAASGGSSGNDPAPATDPAPVATDPAPVATDPAPVATDPAPVATEPAPVTTQAPEPAPVVVKTGFQCPVAGPVAFGDTWGAARSGGRRHEGVDMMAALGTPVVAVVSGSVQMKTTNLGGNSAWVTGNDGNKYFYAHLNAWEGSSRSVSAGEVIGYVGHTGNTTANHLHFEIHPGGGAAVNPYPTVRQYC